MSSDRGQFHSNSFQRPPLTGSPPNSGFGNSPLPGSAHPTSATQPTAQPAPPPASTATTAAAPQPTPTAEQPKPQKPVSEASTKLAAELSKFNEVAEKVRTDLVRSPDFQTRCQQAFDVANELFGNAPTWVCFYRELMGGNGLIHTLFDNNADFGDFLRTDQYHQIQMMLTALRSRDLPENDPNDPQRMITVRLPKSLHEAMCDEAGRLNISVNRLCISRMLQLLDPKMIPETNSKPRGRKPRTRQKQQSQQG